MSSTTCMIESSTGARWLSGPIRPIVPTIAGDGQQQRHSRRDQRAERDDQQDQRDRQRPEGRLRRSLSKTSMNCSSVLPEPNCSTLKSRCDFCAARGLAPGSRRPWRHRLVLGVTRDLEADEHRVPVARDRRRVLLVVGTVERLDALGRLEPLLHVGYDGVELGVLGLEALALDQHRLLVLVGERPGHDLRPCRSRRRPPGPARA